MKIKVGFVTNSSSTAYIVFMPDKFYADKDQIIKCMENIVWDEDVPDDPDTDDYKLHVNRLIEEVEESIETLKCGDKIYSDDGGITNEVFEIILNIVDFNDLYITSVDMGPQEHIMLPITEENILSICEKNSNKMKMFEGIFYENKNSTCNK
jgi:hypothetical protein